jgi:DNA-binding NarL/FixJ family response regulator
MLDWKGYMMPDERVIRLLIAEDHELVREALRYTMSEDPCLSVVAEACTGHDVLPLVRQYQPDAVILDLDLPGQDGLAVLQTLRTHVHRPPRTIILSGFYNEEYVRRACELGAAGYLSKDCAGARLRQAVHQVIAGGRVFEPAITAILRRQHYNRSGRFQRYTDGSLALSTAETGVLRKLVGEQTCEEIAGEMGRCPGTVRTQAAAIYRKLDVCNRQQAVLKALRLGIIQPDCSGT